MFSIPFTAEKSITINQPVNQVFNYIADFANWDCWSPWLIQEPDCPITRTAEPATVGHAQAWNGKQIGKGEIKISALQQDKSIDYDLTFYAPWKSQSKTQFKLTESTTETGEQACHVVWSMQGSLPIFMFFWKKLMSALVGSDYERGLKMLKEQLETGTVNSKVTVDGVKQNKAFYSYGYRVAGSTETVSADVGPVFQKLCSAGFPEPDLVITQVEKFDFVSKQSQLIVAMAYHTKPTFEFPADVVESFVPEHKALAVTHIGSYANLANGWATLMGYLQNRENKLKANKKIPEYEVYLNSPEQVSESELKTVIYAPVK
ncbi:SRPBCC family protein [Catenovulum agarivorans]|nr:SRPBCC family protein [Catenovulum agarivorans]